MTKAETIEDLKKEIAELNADREVADLKAQIEALKNPPKTDKDSKKLSCQEENDVLQARIRCVQCGVWSLDDHVFVRVLAGGAPGAGHFHSALAFMARMAALPRDGARGTHSPTFFLLEHKGDALACQPVRALLPLTASPRRSRARRPRPRRRRHSRGRCRADPSTTAQRQN